MSYYKRWNTVLAVLFIFSILVGCSAPQEMKSPNQSVARDSAGESATKMATMEDASTTNSSPKKLQGASLPSTEMGRKMVYTAQVHLTVKDYKQARTEIEQVVKNHKGYLVNGSESKTQEAQTGTFTFRVPQTQFDAFMKEIQKLDIATPSVEISSNDVTEEMVDLESRLKAKEAMEKRLLDLLQKATKTEDLLEISRQLDQTQVEIEQIKGRLQYLNNKVELSTVTVTITQRLVALSSPDQPLGTQMVDTFLASLSGLGIATEYLLIFLSGALPVILVLAVFAVIFIYLFRLFRRLRQK